jgi:4-diphosphocytidyl-2-C-methyl-D-erythritol kinase
MVVFPNAKINIGLHIINKREDGYHNLESIFYPIGLCDILEIQKSTHFQFTQTGLEIGGDPLKNLVVRAYNLVQEKLGIDPVHIHLHKVIPTGAGIGGGSADATFMIIALDKLFDLQLTNRELKDLALQCGSDCPFFVENSPALVTGRGENVEKIDFSLKNYWIKLVHPGIHSSTKDAFSGCRPRTKSTLNKSVIKDDIKSFSKLFINDFEQTIFRIYPEVAKIKTALENEGSLYTSMSGSGSSVYGIFESKPEKTMPGYFEYIGKLRF